MNKKEYEKLINNLKKSDEKYYKQYAGNILKGIRDTEYKNNLPALSKTLMDCSCFNKSNIKIESAERTIHRWTTEGLPLNKILCISECLDKDIGLFFPISSLNNSFVEYEKINFADHRKYNDGLFIMINDYSIFIKNPSIFFCLQSLLDFLYINFLKEDFEPYTYGYKWVMVTDLRQLVVPMEWFFSQEGQKYEFNHKWSINKTLSECHIHSNTHLKLITPDFLIGKRLGLICTNVKEITNINIWDNRNPKNPPLFARKTFHRSTECPPNINMYKYYSIIYDLFGYPNSKYFYIYQTTDEIDKEELLYYYKYNSKLAEERTGWELALEWHEKTEHIYKRSLKEADLEKNYPDVAIILNKGCE